MHRDADAASRGNASSMDAPIGSEIGPEPGPLGITYWRGRSEHRSSRSNLPSTNRAGKVAGKAKAQFGAGSRKWQTGCVYSMQLIRVRSTTPSMTRRSTPSAARRGSRPSASGLICVAFDPATSPRSSAGSRPETPSGTLGRRAKRPATNGTAPTSHSRASSDLTGVRRIAFTSRRVLARATASATIGWQHQPARRRSDGTVSLEIGGQQVACRR
jgi:hypothetical protein